MTKIQMQFWIELKNLFYFDIFLCAFKIHVISEGTFTKNKQEVKRDLYKGEVWFKLFE